jgi:predicted RNA binding protein YcfA (HicA-like mRNA interferase family)
MTFKPVPTKKFKKVLKKLGLKHIRDHGDHEIWDYPEDGKLLRPVTIIGCDKTIPALHIQTNLKTLGLSYKEFQDKLDKV